jgi:hypothetical protein
MDPAGARDIAPVQNILQIPLGAMLVRVLGVNYVHVRTTDGGELYLTAHGMPYLEHLKPENWYAPDWFVPRRLRLKGTSSIYKVPTRDVGGRALDLVVKYSRVGQDVPLETRVIYEVINAEFNSPFEEFSLVEELRLSEHGPADMKVNPMIPLGIYVPPEKMQLWQTGRSEQKIAGKIARHPGIEIDILRDYILVYAWIYGIDAVEAQEAGRLSQAEMERLTVRATDEIHAKGFRVLDMKPHHIIVFPENGSLKQDDGRPAYRLVDFELLQRTEEYDKAVKSSRRSQYLVRQRDRFADRQIPFPEHLKPVSFLGVDYVFGHAESTGGLLWIVGKDPILFDYFLPERWRKTPHIRLSEENQIFYTWSKDNIHLVWRVSRVGEAPDIPADHPAPDRIRAYGYNSPFEEFAYALRLRRHGLITIYPRAVYMTGHRAPDAGRAVDDSRIRSHGLLRTPEGDPILRVDRDYITVWGFWNGPDEMLAQKDGDYYRGVNAERACFHGLLTQEQAEERLEHQRRRMRAAGLEALDLKKDHLLISVDPKGALVRDAAGCIETCLCNFHLLRPADGPA